MTTTITTQAELDAALTAGETDIIINSDSGVWIELTSPSSSRVVARGSSRVVAWGSSRVEAWESSRVEARGSSRVEARGSSSVEAWGSSRVEAWGSSRVVAWGSSRVVAWGSSSVEARESSRVEASDFVAVHLHSSRATVQGGVVIDITAIDLDDPIVWAAYHGLKDGEEGQVIVYKAVNQELVAGQGYRLTPYPIGQTVTAPDWSPVQECGAGLHFSPSPAAAKRYFGGAGEPRFLACSISAADFVTLTDKLKAESCSVLHEVTIHGDVVEAAAAVTP